MSTNENAQSAGNPNLLLLAIGWVALLAGLIFGGMALVSVVGVWLGAWGFQSAFQILFFVTGPWGDVVAIICLLDAITIRPLDPTGPGNE